ncbi:hypothetical protein SKAU_G00314540 [Synaphobranchus kaupii]|uniref:Uncharacterized protein n=1 Tax=Synaphobranchus kaupii TaxID=118154 RepID=A0A9Q1ILP5_SYNKA|nr:hypothetical protein SKAU_G00314540 [Synaphobranchus kaupii]
MEAVAEDSNKALGPAGTGRAALSGARRGLPRPAATVAMCGGLARLTHPASSTSPGLEGLSGHQCPRLFYLQCGAEAGPSLSVEKCARAVRADLRPGLSVSAGTRVNKNDSVLSSPRDRYLIRGGGRPPDASPPDPPPPPPPRPLRPPGTAAAPGGAAELT